MTSNNSSRKILVVDDHITNCEIIDGFLMILGYKNRKDNTTYVHDGYQAINHIKVALEERDPYRYGLILIECMIPFIDG